MVNKRVIISMVLLFLLVNVISATHFDCDENLISWWRFNEGSGVFTNDYCGRNNGTISGGALWTTGIQGTALLFDGVDNHVHIPTSDSLNLTDDYSIALWLKPSVIGATDILIFKDSAYRVRFPATNPDRIAVEFYRAGYKTTISDDAVISEDNWTFVTATISTTPESEEVNIYIDGVLNATKSGFTGTGIAETSLSDLVFGSDFTSGSWYNGVLDNIMFFDKILNATEIQELYNLTILPCEENWTAEYTACNISDNRTLYYIDENECGTNSTLPVDNGTIESCNYCSADFECSLFDGQCGDNNETQPLFLNCTNVTDNNFGTCCSVTGLFSDCNYTIEDYNALCGDIDVQLVVPYYPYVDLNSEYEMNLYLLRNGVSMNLTDFMIDVGGDTFNFTWDNSNEYYDLTLIFSEIGDYPFTIYARYPYEKIGNITGTLIVREPCYITFEGYETKNQQVSGKYDNDFAYIIAEKTEKQYYDKILEKFITPLLFKGTYKSNVFYAPYTNGEATLKLWDNSTNYAVRLIDGDIDFDGQYSVPNITESYYTNIYLDNYNFNCNGKNETLKIYFSSSDITPYRSLFNWAFVIGLGLIAVISVFMFFVIPEYSQLSVIFGLGFTLMLVAGRVVLFFVFGW